MACGCKDKEKDAIIIAEVERRKSSNGNEIYETFQFDGDLILAISMLNQDNIIQIVKTEDEKWDIISKSQK